MRDIDKFRGCLLGGAAGDALARHGDGSRHVDGSFALLFSADSFNDCFADSGKTG